MRNIAAVILNRNLPGLVDGLGGWMTDNFSDSLDIHVAENGSDPGKYSKFATIKFKESFGPAKGINESLKILLEKEYDYFWVNFNDARYKDPQFIKKAIETMEANDRVGVFAGYWPGNTWIKESNNLSAASLRLVSFFDPLGFVVSRKALEVCRSYGRINLDPLWDSSNFSNHANVLGTSLALYENNMCMTTDVSSEIYEERDPADNHSEEARGFDDKKWKEEIGPRDLRNWLLRTFPEKKPGLFSRLTQRRPIIKVMRDGVIEKIEAAIGNNTYGF